MRSVRQTVLPTFKSPVTFSTEGSDYSASAFHSSASPLLVRGSLRNSEDSVKLNTSFVERLNLTIRQGSSYLGQARRKQYLDGHLELLRCHLQLREASQGAEIRT